MSTAAQPSLALHSSTPSRWPAWATFAADVLALELSFSLGLTFRTFFASYFTANIALPQYLGVAAALLLLPIINYQLGLYPGYLLSPVERLRRRYLATFAVFGALIAWDNLVARGVLSRGVLLATLLFALVLPPLAELAARTFLIRRDKWGVPVLILGAGAAGRALLQKRRNEPTDFDIRPVAFLDNRPDLWNIDIAGVPVAGPLALAPDFETRAHVAIVNLADIPKSDAAQLLNELNFARVIVIPDLPPSLATGATMWITARQFGGSVGFEIKKNLLLRRNLVLKAIMDRAIALPLFLLSLPIIAIAALWIKLTSRGPVFYCQNREGLAVWKLRTMQMDGDRVLEQWFESHPHDKEHWNRHFKLRHDPRVLKGIGPLLRRTSLDELPQLWTIITGKMSLVGPRPLPDYHLEAFDPEFRSLRTRVLPGLTGLWQVSTRSEGDAETIEAMDTYYIRNWSPWLDLYILARTVTAVLLARGAY